jgi:hypothetical protein
MDQKRRPVELELVGTDESGKTILEIIESTEEARAAGSTAAQAEAGAASETESATVPERLELTASREIVLRCGDASITLTRAGKIILRGAYLLSRSSGVNKIKGGSVQIN